MTERIDHVAEAWEVWRDGKARGHPDARDNPAHESLLHMVNALVEQQRVGNMIALLATAARGVAEQTHSVQDYMEMFNRLNPQVIKGLGLNEGENDD